MTKEKKSSLTDRVYRRMYNFNTYVWPSLASGCIGMEITYLHGVDRNIFGQLGFYVGDASNGGLFIHLAFGSKFLIYKISRDERLANLSQKAIIGLGLLTIALNEIVHFPPVGTPDIGDIPAGVIGMIGTAILYDRVLKLKLPSKLSHNSKQN